MAGSLEYFITAPLSLDFLHHDTSGLLPALWQQRSRIPASQQSTLVFSYGVGLLTESWISMP